MIFVDSNVFIYAVGRPHPLREEAQRFFLKANEEGNFDAVFNKFLNILKEQFSVMNLAKFWTSYYTAHEVIDPRETRPRIIRALEAVQSKIEELPEKKRSIKPA